MAEQVPGPPANSGLSDDDYIPSDLPSASSPPLLGAATAFSSSIVHEHH